MAGVGDLKKEVTNQVATRTNNLQAVQQLASCVKSSLGPRGQDKMVIHPRGEVVISNDGATILKDLETTQPAAKFLQDAAVAQDTEAGDGTTSVVVFAGGLMRSAEENIERGIHVRDVMDGYQLALEEGVKYISSVAQPIPSEDMERSLIEASNTALASKVVAQYSRELSPIAVKAVMMAEGRKSEIKVVKALGLTIEDTALVEGLVFSQKTSKSAGGPSRISNAKIGLIQFQLSPPKTDIENNVIITDYQAMDRALKEERKYLLGLCKQIQKSGCNVLFIQKSILRDAVTDMSLHFLAKLGILVVKDVERSDVPMICKAVGCLPVANIDSMTPAKLGSAAKVEEVKTADGRLIQITGVKVGTPVSVVVRGSTKQLVDEAERSLNDALCVAQCLHRLPQTLKGGGAPEIAIALHLTQFAQTVPGVKGVCVQAFADALEIIPEVLAENAGLDPVTVVSQLRIAHNEGKHAAALDVRRGVVTEDSQIVVPLQVVLCMLRHATETVRMILRIDDIMATR